MATINNRLDDVIKELGNRADIQSGAPSRVALWYRNAYISLAMGYNFEQLENSFVFSTAPSQFEIGFPSTSRAINSLVIYDSSGTPSVPTFKDIQSVRQLGDFTGVSGTQLTSGRPSTYTLYENNLFFSPPFDSNGYFVVLDTWEKPAISADVISTVLNVPDDWLEALDYSAIMRGHAILGEPDKAMAIQRLLFGYTDPTSGKYVPGLLSNLQTRKQANAPARDYGLAVRTLKQGGYTR